MHAADLLTNRARLTPEREALLELATGRRFTYAGLNQRANRLANFLAGGLGIGAGDRVSILAHNDVAYLDLLFGLAKIGAIFAPLNWRLAAAELAYIANDCAPAALVVGPEFAGVAAHLRPHVTIPHWISLDGAEVVDALPYAPSLAAAAAAEPARPALHAGSPYCILYTSGTSGRPKGAVLPHRQILWNCINTVISWGLTEQDVSPVFTPLFHAGGLFAFLTPVLYAGGRVVLARGFDAGQSLRTIEDERCTVILGVPTLFQLWLDAPGFDAASFAAVRFFISGGAPLPVPLVQAWRERKAVAFRQGYGLTEVGPNCFSMTDAESVPKTGSVGKPILHSRMRLVDPVTRADVPPGETGELLISGPHVCTGYWQDVEATASALNASLDPGWAWPWFHTGDMARMDADGFYTITGRLKDMIITGGENVYAAEVEAALRQHPAVQDAALIGLPDARWGEVGLAVVALKPGSPASADDLRQFCLARLAPYKVPKAIAYVESLPYSPYGKVLKGELRQRFAPAPAPPAGP
jgi:fatty-acyl-CoA synthase